MAWSGRATASLRVLLAFLLLSGVAAAGARAQIPYNSDHPAGNVDELTLAGLRPGRSPLASALKKLGGGWSHPSRDETDVYVWCDAKTRMRISLEVQSGVVHVVTVEQLLPGLARGCHARLARSLAATGRGMRLGGSEARLRAIYGKPFFHGPASWDGKDVDLIVFNFTWAGSDKPHILESSFLHGRLVKMTLSKDYY